MCTHLVLMCYGGFLLKTRTWTFFFSTNQESVSAVILSHWTMATSLPFLIKESLSQDHSEIGGNANI